MKRELFEGAAAGLIATVPMTFAMEAMRRRLPVQQRYALPPRPTTMNLASHVGLRSHLNEQQRKDLTLASHFSYGTVVGSLYGSLFSRMVPPSVGSGMMYGMLVWAGSYLGLLPALGLLSPATEHPRRRSLLMIAAHLVWGGVTGGLVRATRR